MKATWVLVWTVLAAGLLGFGCKSDDERMAAALEEEVWTPVEAAKASGDEDKLQKACLAMWMALEAPEVRRLVKIGGLTTDVKKKLEKACEGMPSVADRIKAELDREVERGREEGASGAAH